MKYFIFPLLLHYNKSLRENGAYELEMLTDNPSTYK